MSIELVEVTRNTRGLNSREIKFKAIGKYVTKTVQRESKPAVKEDGTPDLDEKGNQKRIPLGKDADGKLITIPEEVQEFEVAGVLTDIADAMELVGGEEQVLLDCFAEGFNARAYDLEADKDELDEFMKDFQLTDDQRKAFKRTANSLAKSLEVSPLEGAEILKAQMDKRAAAKAAAA